MFDKFKFFYKSYFETVGNIYFSQLFDNNILYITNIQFSINYSAKYDQPTGTEGEYRKNLVRELYSSMFVSRFREVTQKENPPFVFAGIDFSSYAKFHENFSINGAVGSTQDVMVGINAALEEVERVKRFGFSDAELERAKKNALSGFERSWNNRDKTESAVFVDEYLRNFTDDELVAAAVSPILLVIFSFIQVSPALSSISNIHPP